MFEEFYTSDDNVNFNLYKSIGVIKNSYNLSYFEVKKTIKKIENVFRSNTYEKNDIIKIMKEVLIDFNHIETGKSLDQKM